MITVTIAINGRVILARTAVRRSKNRSSEASAYVYDVDDGSELWHDPRDGAVPLAIAMLRTIEEPGKESGDG